MLPASAALAVCGHLHSGKLSCLQACFSAVQAFSSLWQSDGFVNILNPRSKRGLAILSGTWEEEIWESPLQVELAAKNLPRGKSRAVYGRNRINAVKKQSLSGIWPCKQRFPWQKCRQFRKALKPFRQATLFRQHAPLQVGLQSAGKACKRKNCPDEEEISGSFCALRQSAGSLRPLTFVQVCFPALQLSYHSVSLSALSTPCPAPSGDFRAPAKPANAKIALMKKWTVPCSTDREIKGLS